jgi:hypothetical protein
MSQLGPVPQAPLSLMIAPAPSIISFQGENALDTLEKFMVVLKAIKEQPLSYSEKIVYFIHKVLCWLNRGAKILCFKGVVYRKLHVKPWLIGI